MESCEVESNICDGTTSGVEVSHVGIKNFAKRAAIGGAVGGTAVVVAGALAVGLRD
jgi:hypothetical protein